MSFALTPEEVKQMSPEEVKRKINYYELELLPKMTRIVEEMKNELAMLKAAGETARS